MPVYLTVHELGGDAGGSRCGSDELGGSVYPDDANAPPATWRRSGGAIGDVWTHGRTHDWEREREDVRVRGSEFAVDGHAKCRGRTLAVWIGDRGDALGFSSGKVPYVCAVIEDGDSTGKVITARATLGTALGKISGVVTHRQPANDASADTGVAVRLVNRAQGGNCDDELSMGDLFGVGRKLEFVRGRGRGV